MIGADFTPQSPSTTILSTIKLLLAYPGYSSPDPAYNLKIFNNNVITLTKQEAESQQLIAGSTDSAAV